MQPRAIRALALSKKKLKKEKKIGSDHVLLKKRGKKPGQTKSRQDHTTKHIIHHRSNTAP
jgi:hypothetical protein